MQAEELRKSLWAKNVPAKVYVGMRYWHPFTEEAIEQVFDHVVIRLQCEIRWHLIKIMPPRSDLFFQVSTGCHLMLLSL